MKLRTVDLFCGGGGLSQGLLDAGFSIVTAMDNWPFALDFYRKNLPGHLVIEIDLSNIKLVMNHLDDLEIDVIAGGPPCQDFSSAGNREEGERANLTISFAQIVTQVRPQFFIMENVERARKSDAFREATRLFKQNGYGLTEAVLNAALCGAPQSRKRVVVFGELDGADNALIPIYKQKQSDHYMTLREYFGEKLNIEHYYRHPRSYARRGVFSIDEPSPTVRGVNRPVPKGYPGHKGDPVPVTENLRTLTTRERSMIQTFPENWDLSGTKTNLEQVIGNAVPCNLAKFVGESIVEHLLNKDNYNQKNNTVEQLVLFEQRPTYPQDILHPSVST